MGPAYAPAVAAATGSRHVSQVAAPAQPSLGRGELEDSLAGDLAVRQPLPHPELDPPDRHPERLGQLTFRKPQFGDLRTVLGERGQLPLDRVELVLEEEEGPVGHEPALLKSVVQSTRPRRRVLTVDPAKW